MTKPQEMHPEPMAKIRTFAQSILSAVQSLEELDVDPSWEPEAVHQYLDETIDALVKADRSLYGTLEDLSEAMLP